MLLLRLATPTQQSICTQMTSRCCGNVEALSKRKFVDLRNNSIVENSIIHNWKRQWFFCVRRLCWKEQWVVSVVLKLFAFFAHSASKRYWFQNLNHCCNAVHFRMISTLDYDMMRRDSDGGVLDSFRQYGNSKTAINLITGEFDRRLADYQVTAVSLTPGTYLSCRIFLLQRRFTLIPYLSWTVRRHESVQIMYYSLASVYGKQFFFAETFWYLEHFGHLSRGSIKTRRNSICFQALWPNWPNFLGHLKKNSLYDRKRLTSA